MGKEIKSIQNDENYVILNNPLATPKFLRKISKSEYKPLSLRDTYTPKIFYEIASRLKIEHLENLKINESLVIDIETRNFAEAIGAKDNNNFYTDIKNAALDLSDIKISFKGVDGLQTTVGIVTKVKEDIRGRIILFVDSELAHEILKVKDKNNFSFLKSNVFRLKNAQAIRLYPFLKSWLNYCFNEKTGKKQPYETELERFREQFGYNTKGYSKFSNFKLKVLDPAIEEINDKTDLIVSYETTGENLDGLRPRVTGLMFRILPKDQVIKKQLPSAEVQPQEPPLKKVTTATVEALKPTASQPQAPQEQPKPQNEFSVIDQETTETLKKIDPKITGEQINHLIKAHGNIRFWEIAQGALTEHKKVPIKNLIGFIKNSSDMLGLGLYKQKAEKIQKEQEKKAKERTEQQAQIQLKEFIKGYDITAHTNFMQAYNDMPQEQKAHYKAYIQQKMPFAKSHFYTGEELNDSGKNLAGQYATLGEDYDRKKDIVRYAHSQGIILRQDPNKETGFVIESMTEPTASQPQAPQEQQTQTTQQEPTTDQQENIENHKKGLLNKFSNWFKN